MLHLEAIVDGARRSLAGGSASPTCTFCQVCGRLDAGAGFARSGLDEGGVDLPAATREALAVEREETFGRERQDPIGQGVPDLPGACEADLAGAHDASAQERDRGAQVIRLRPLRVLVLSADEPFRAASAMLIGRRDCTVFSLLDAYGAAELIARERIDVAVVDGAAQLRALADELANAVPSVGVVSIGEAEDVGSPGGPMLARWVRFEALFDAIERAERGRVRRCPTEGRWPAGARSHRLD